MRINSISKTPPYNPSFKQNSKFPIKEPLLLLGGYIGGCLTILLIEDLEYLSRINRFYHEQIGVYTR